MVNYDSKGVRPADQLCRSELSTTEQRLRKITYEKLPKATFRQSKIKLAENSLNIIIYFAFFRCPPTIPLCQSTCLYILLFSS